MEKILTVTNVAEILQVKAITVREMFREKRLRGFKVGKSWRTTESMLREDIDALARGESPADLPTPSSAGPVTAKAPAEVLPAPVAPAAPAARKSVPKAAAVAGAPPKPRPTRNPAPDTEEDVDDTQQMLF